MKKALLEYGWKTTDYFPVSSLPDQVFQDVVRAITINEGLDFDLMLRGQRPPAEFNADGQVFKDQDLLAQIVRFLVDKDFSIDQATQGLIDDAMSAYLAKHQRKVEKEKTKLARPTVMPLSKLTLREMEDINRI